MSTIDRNYGYEANATRLLGRAMNNPLAMVADPALLDAMTASRRAAMRYWLRLACDEAARSPDPSTKNGAVLICQKRETGAAWDGLPVVEGVVCDCNRFSVFDNAGMLPAKRQSIEAGLVADRDAKLRAIEHAERNAIFSAVQAGLSPVGSILVCPYAACCDCARAITLCGVKELVRLPAERLGGLANNPWRDAILAADYLMIDAGVKITNYDGPPLDRTMLINKTSWSV